MSVPKKSSETKSQNSIELPSLGGTPLPQNTVAIEQQITARAVTTKQSLQELDKRLSQFEDKFADAAISRIDSMPERIQQKIVLGLQSRAQSTIEIVETLEALTIPEFPMPYAAIVLGILPAAY